MAATAAAAATTTTTTLHVPLNVSLPLLAADKQSTKQVSVIFKKDTHETLRNKELYTLEIVDKKYRRVIHLEPSTFCGLLQGKRNQMERSTTFKLVPFRKKSKLPVRHLLAIISHKQEAVVFQAEALAKQDIKNMKRLLTTIEQALGHVGQWDVNVLGTSGSLRLPSGLATLHMTSSAVSLTSSWQIMPKPIPPVVIATWPLSSASHCSKTSGMRLKISIRGKQGSRLGVINLFSQYSEDIREKFRSQERPDPGAGPGTVEAGVVTGGATMRGEKVARGLHRKASVYNWPHENFRENSKTATWWQHEDPRRSVAREDRQSRADRSSTLVDAMDLENVDPVYNNLPERVPVYVNFSECPPPTFGQQGEETSRTSGGLGYGLPQKLTLDVAHHSYFYYSNPDLGRKTESCSSDDSDSTFCEIEHLRRPWPHFYANPLYGLKGDPDQYMNVDCVQKHLHESRAEDPGHEEAPMGSPRRCPDGLPSTTLVKDINTDLYSIYVPDRFRHMSEQVGVEREEEKEGELPPDSVYFHPMCFLLWCIDNGQEQDIVNVLQLSKPARLKLGWSLYKSHTHDCCADWEQLASALCMDEETVMYVHRFENTRRRTLTAGEIVLKFWEYAHAQYGEDNSFCGVTCSRQNLSQLLAQINRLDLQQDLDTMAVKDEC